MLILLSANWLTEVVLNLYVGPKISHNQVSSLNRIKNRH